MQSVDLILPPIVLIPQLPSFFIFSFFLEDVVWVSSLEFLNLKINFAIFARFEFFDDV